MSTTVTLNKKINLGQLAQELPDVAMEVQGNTLKADTDETTLLEALSKHKPLADVVSPLPQATVVVDPMIDFMDQLSAASSLDEVKVALLEHLPNILRR